MTDHLAAPSKPVDNRWIALVVLCVGMLMIILDTTIVNVALPSIQDDLGFSQSTLAWVVNGYLIAFGGLLLLAGRLGDLIGRRRVFLAGLGVFTVASLLCGAAQSQEMLIGARFVQGIGGAMTSAVILGMIVTMFPQPAEQARAIGIFSFVAAAGASIGLLAGGALTEAINWHWIFFVNLPIGVAAAVFARRLLEDDRGIGLDRGADVPGALLVTSAVMLAVYTIVEAAQAGWASMQTLGLAAVSAALLAAFVLRESRVAHPLVPLRIFRVRAVVAANVVQALMIAGMFGMFFLGALYLQRILGYGAIEVGLAFLPVAVTIGVLSVAVSPRLIIRFGGKATLLPGLALMAAGLVWFQPAPVDAVYLTDLFPAMLLLGLGAGLSFPALMTLAMSGATPDDAGLASGLINTTQQVGGALGLAVLATLSTTRTETLIGRGEQAAEALTDGYRLAFAIAAGVVLAGLAVAAAVLRTPSEPGSEVELVAQFDGRPGGIILDEAA
jgi:EmrB/QacA subfamily drug resistance transporter